MAAMARWPAMAPADGAGERASAAAAAAAAAEEMRWRQLDSGVSAVSFGFVATAILVSMFLAMAILEHFLRPPAGHASGPGQAPPRGILRRLRLFLGRGSGERGAAPGADLEAAGKLQGHAPLEIPVYPKGVSVLMPGQDMPTFIAHPAPAPCPPERIRWPSHQSSPFTGSSSNPS